MKKPDAVAAKLARTLIRGQLIGGFEEGEYTAQEILNGSALLKEIESFDRWIRSRPRQVFGTVDYRNSILREAKEFALLEKYENAQIFYTLYFEHELNWIINNLLMRKHISDISRKKILRLSFRVKCTWLIEILGEKPPTKSFVDYVDKLSNERNGYVHYKYPSQDMDAEEENTLVKKAPKMVAYIRRYGSRLIYRGEKEQIIAAIHKLVP